MLASVACCIRAGTNHLPALPDDAARAVVSATIVAKLLDDVQDFDAVVRQVAVARKWAAADAAAVFARGDRDNLPNIINLALESDHAEATAYALAASEAFLKVDPEWEGSPYYRSRALVKSGKPDEAIPFYERALGMTTDEDAKKVFTTALDEARAGVQLNATSAAGPVPVPK